MKSNIIFLLINILLFGCKSYDRQKSLSKIEVYNNEIKIYANDSNLKMDTSFINVQYDKSELSSKSKEFIEEIADEHNFIELLKTEKELNNQWEEIKNFNSYSHSKPNKLFGLIRRCASFDRAPKGTQRVPSFPAMRSVSQKYYKVEVPIAFHIISNNIGTGLQGNMENRIINQIQSLNNVYNKFNITFKLNSIDTTINDLWFNKAGYYSDFDALKKMTSLLSKNPAKIMNIYTLESNNLGESTFPWYNENGTTLDYIIINYNTLSDGPITFENGYYTEGKTLIHEVGHFLGLFHTFEGNDTCNSIFNDGCNIGDQVDDTPSQKICYFNGCDENSDSCPARGNDPVRNFMGYNPDDCMNEMTPGQGVRMMQSVIKYRYYLIINPI